MMFLSQDEIEQLTKRKHKSSQIAELNKMGIHFIVRADGSPVVASEHLYEKLGIKSSKGTVKRIEPDWSQCNA